MTADRCDLLCLDLQLAEGLRGARLAFEAAELAATHAAAFSDPTRVTLAASLREGGELCVCDLAWIVERTESLVSHHLRRLRSDGIVRSRREGKMVFYSLTKTGETLLAAVLGSVAAESVP